MKTRSLFGILCVSIATLTAQSSIVYVNGPSIPIPGGWGFGSGDLDLDNDGTVDFSFWSSGQNCTLAIGSGACGWPFYVKTTTTNEVLTSGNAVSPLQWGLLIGTQIPPNSSWTMPGGFYGVGIAYQFHSWQIREGIYEVLNSGWSGGIAEAGIAYVGLRFWTTDGPHYGWVRLRLPNRFLGQNPPFDDGSLVGFPIVEFAPVVVDWAYETQPNTPIRAGDIGTDGDAVQFKVEYFDPSPRNRRPRPVDGTGSLILTDGKLRGELVLSGKVTEAELRGPANLRARTKPVLDFGSPLVSRTDHTAFFGETSLTRAQTIALAHGLIYVSIDDRDLVGRITPVEHDRRRRR